MFAARNMSSSRVQSFAPKYNSHELDNIKRKAFIDQAYSKSIMVDNNELKDVN